MDKAYFVNPNDKENTRLHQLIKTWVKDRLSLEEPLEIMVSEMKCADPGCPDIDTYITVIRDAHEKKYRIAKPLVYVRKWDIEGMKEVK
ncbi:MAG TPA: hypothetical protein VK750_04430 [Cytophagaceae bacterium]|jgi:hypothetical protein|nr:hypothetical protein [Cytophagaceae bacterium]